MLNQHGQDPRLSMDDKTRDAVNAYSMPSVADQGQDKLTMLVGAAALMMLGLVVFNQLSEGRRGAGLDDMVAQTRRELEQAQTDAKQARLDAQQAKAEVLRAKRQLAASSRQPTSTTSKSPANNLPQQASLRSPALVVDNSRQRAGSEGEVVDAVGAVEATVAGLTSSEVFAKRVNGGGLGPAVATVIEDPSRVVPQGAIISGVLETAINSDLPGFTRAIVSEDVRSLDNRNILVPRGSRLIGQYRSGLAIGESRAFVIWTRLLRPDGVSIELTSPATDTLGRAGLAGDVNRHFFQRFGSAILLSVIGAGTNALLYDRNAEVIITSTSEAQAVATQVLSQQMNIPPTITVDQGAEIRIFLARDLLFPRVVEPSGLRP